MDTFKNLLSIADIVFIILAILSLILYSFSQKKVEIRTITWIFFCTFDFFEDYDVIIELIYSFARCCFSIYIIIFNIKYIKNNKKKSY